MMLEEYSFIYALIDPRNEQVRYIGQSVQPEIRLREHMKLSNRTPEKMRDWLWALKACGTRPILRVLGKYLLTEIVEQENAFINQFKGNGFLLNRSVARRHRTTSDVSAIECVETGQTFESCKAAGRAHNCAGATMSSMVKHGYPCMHCGQTFKRVK